jgi:hypothetical protein
MLFGRLSDFAQGTCQESISDYYRLLVQLSKVAVYMILTVSLLAVY